MNDPIEAVFIVLISRAHAVIFPTMNPAENRPVLYFSVRSPFARRVRIAMQRLAYHYQEAEISVFEPTAEFIASSPIGTVPSLSIPGMPFSIGDSTAILEYLHDEFGGKIWPTDSKARTLVRAASVLAESLMTNIVAWYLENQRKQPSTEWSSEYLENLDRVFSKIASQELNAMPWKSSPLQLTQAGYDLIVALQYAEIRLKGVDWKAKYPTLSQFVENHKNRGDILPTTPPAA